MNNQQNLSSLSIGETGSLLMGAGLPVLMTSLNIGLILIGAGVLLKVLVAVLQKYQVPISTPPLG